MAVVVSLSSSQDLGTGPFLSLTKKFHGLSSYVFKAHFNIILLHTPAFPRKSVNVFHPESFLLAVKKYNFAFT
jgi:hypothetical protein